MSWWRLTAGVGRRALRNLIEQRRLHLLSNSVMAVSLTLLGAFLVLASNLAAVRERLGEAHQVTAFMAAGLDAAGQATLRAQAEALPGVATVEVVDTAHAAEQFRATLGPHGSILDELGADVIPASLTITAVPGTTADGMVELAKELEGLVGVEEVVYALEELRRLSALIRIVEIVALAIGALIALVTVIVVANTIRLTVMAREDEIAIMKLVGATDNFVRLPFVLEGLLGGLGAGVVAVVLLWVLHGGLMTALDPLTAGVLGEVTLVAPRLEQVLLLIGCGALLGLVGGVVSVGRFLRDSA